MNYLHKWNCWKKEKVHIESQDAQGDWGDVVKAHLEQLGGQEQQAQLGSPLSVSHLETSLRRDNCEMIFLDSFAFCYHKIYSGRKQERWWDVGGGSLSQ